MPHTLHDINNDDDVRKFVDAFYDLVMNDDLLGPVFNDIAQVNWDNHLPRMYAFWGSMLLGGRSYFGQPYPIHEALLPHVEKKHFDRWLTLFISTIDTYFAGERAELAKERAHNIAIAFQAKMGLLESPWVAPKPNAES